jgi:hypothetical protein
VATNRELLHPTDMQRTYQAVIRIHPLNGCAMLPMPTFTGAESTFELSTFADAVTVACISKIPHFPDNVLLTDANATSVANMAFIALSPACDKATQSRALEFLQRWRRLCRDR